MSGEVSMAYSPVDPMSLQGEALRRWYIRSPNDIEEERRRAHAQRFEAFFGGGRRPSQAPTPKIHNQHSEALAVQASEPIWASIDSSRWSSRPAPSLGFNANEGRVPNRIGSHGASRSGACQSAKGWAAPKGGVNCVSCHGRIAPQVPSPFPWTNPPATRNMLQTPPADPPRGPPKQCEIQNARDTEICTRQPNPTARAMCHESASERLQYCIKTKGEVGHPRLFTHPNGPQR